LKQNKNGITYPGKLYIQLNKLKKTKRVFHTISISDLEINSFPLSRLYPSNDVKFLGDSKL
ncbi:MAG: hypothetical protein AAGD17_06695, partial [Bacteroidota bacterium]